MKTIFFSLVTLLSASAFSAESCSTLKLNCTLVKRTFNQPEVLLAKTVSEFSDANSDEPSLPLPTCELRTYLEDNNGINFIVQVDDAEMMTNIYLTRNSNPGHVLPGSVAFNATPGKTFYMGYDSSVLSCVLK